MNDELRDQLAGLDPMHSEVTTEDVTTTSSRELLEHIMSTPTMERPERELRPRRRAWYAVATAALIVPSFAFLKDWCAQQRIPFTDRAQVVREPTPRPRRSSRPRRSNSGSVTAPGSPRAFPCRPTSCATCRRRSSVPLRRSMASR